MFNNVFELIKDGIRALAERLGQAKANRDALQPAIDAARDKLNNAIADRDVAEALEQAAWDDLEDAYDLYEEMLQNYYDCLAGRQICIEEHPEECEGVPLEQDYQSPGGEETQTPELPEGLFDGDFWDSILKALQDQEQEKINEAGDSADEAGDALDQAEEDLDSSEQALEDAFDELEDDIDAIEEWTNNLDRLLQDLPDGLWLSDLTIGFTERGELSEDEGLRAIGPDGIIIKRDDLSGDFDTEMVSLELKPTPSISLIPFINNYSDARNDYVVKIGEEAGTIARLSEIPYLSDLFDDKFGLRDDSMKEKTELLIFITAQISDLEED